MSDFDDLRQMREAKERAEESARQKAREDERRKAETIRRRDERVIKEVRALDATVTSVLEDLRKSAYPDLARHAEDGYEIFGGGWARWQITRPVWDFERVTRHPVVTVVLRFDEDGQPLHFSVYRESVVINEFVPTPGLIMSRLLRTRSDVRYGQVRDGQRLVTFRQLACDPTREELVRTVRRLHPSHTIGARPNLPPALIAL